MYDQIDDIINNLSLKYRVNNNLTVSSIDHVFNEIKSKMGQENLPNILIHNWGRFKPNIRYLKYKIKNLYKSIKENGSKGDQFDRLTKYITVYKRLCSEEKIEFTEEFIKIENFTKESFNEERK